VVALFSLLGMAVNLQGIVDNELITEISLAAGINLVDTYVDTYVTVEALEAELALADTPGAKYAFEQAIFKLTGGIGQYADITKDEAIALGTQNAADAYAFYNRAGFAKPQALLDAIAGAETDELAIAYGKILGGFYGPGSPVGQMAEADLVVLAKEGETLGERVAAATALTTYWILGSDLTYVDVQNEILGVMLVYPELALAYQGYLAYLYSL
jgi:hypothetical protein